MATAWWYGCVESCRYRSIEVAISLRSLENGKSFQHIPWGDTENGETHGADSNSMRSIATRPRSNSA